MNSVPHSFVYCAGISVSRNTEISPIPGAVRGGCCGAWAMRPFGLLTGCAAPTDAGLWCLEQTIPADQGHDLPIHSHPPCTGELGAPPSLCLPRGVPVAASPFELESRSDVNCSLDTKIAGTCFSHAGLGWAVPALAGQGEWWGFLCPALGRSMDRPLAGLLPGLCRINKTPKLCQPLITSISVSSAACFSVWLGFFPLWF